MNGNVAIHPHDALREIDERCRACAAGLPGKVENASEWAGIAFRLGNNNLVSRLGEVIEILDFPALSKVPMARDWVLGIANVRGNLLPVIDLHGLLEGTPTVIGEKTRVLVIDYEGIYSGLVVDEVNGLKYFMEEERVEEGGHVDACLQAFASHGYRRDNETWNVISLHELADSPQFLQAAV